MKHIVTETCIIGKLGTLLHTSTTSNYKDIVGGGQGNFCFQEIVSKPFHHGIIGQNIHLSFSYSVLPLTNFFS